MAFIPRLRLALGGLSLGLFTLANASAATVSYTGTLSTDDQVQLYTYTLAQASTVVFQTTSYATGGFVPVISLFNAAGTLLASDGADATCSAGMTASPTTHICDDAFLSQSLASGSYTVALTEFFNVPVGPTLANGFLEQGQGNFTGPTCSTMGGFYQTDIAPCVQRTNAFALNITNTVSGVPEPSTFWLGALPMIIFGAARFSVSRRRSVRVRN